MLANLVPGDYLVCYDATSRCASTSYYAAARHSTVGPASWQPFSVPAGTSTGVGMSAMQVVKLVLTTNASFPRISTVDPAQTSASATDASATQITITGANLSGATVSLVQGAVTVDGTTIGADSSTSIERQFNVQGVIQGVYEVRVTTVAGTVVQTGLAPGLLGGFIVLP